MDTEDALRISAHLRRLLETLQRLGTMTNHEVRALAGSRGMGRVNDLQKKGYPITVRKLKGADWEIRWDQPALGRAADHRVDPDADLPLFPEPHIAGWQER